MNHQTSSVERRDTGGFHLELLAATPLRSFQDRGVFSRRVPVVSRRRSTDRLINGVTSGTKTFKSKPLICSKPNDSLRCPTGRNALQTARYMAFSCSRQIRNPPFCADPPFQGLLPDWLRIVNGKCDNDYFGLGLAGGLEDSGLGASDFGGTFGLSGFGSGFGVGFSFGRAGGAAGFGALDLVAAADLGFGSIFASACGSS